MTRAMMLSSVVAALVALVEGNCYLKGTVYDADRGTAIKLGLANRCTGNRSPGSCSGFRHPNTGASGICEWYGAGRAEELGGGAARAYFNPGREVSRAEEDAQRYRECPDPPCLYGAEEDARRYRECPDPPCLYRAESGEVEPVRAETDAQRWRPCAGPPCRAEEAEEAARVEADAQRWRPCAGPPCRAVADWVEAGEYGSVLVAGGVVVSLVAVTGAAWKVWSARKWEARDETFNAV